MQIVYLGMVFQIIILVNYIYMNISLDYYTIVISVAIFVFIITMILFWYFGNVKSDEFPPIMSNCPHNWTVNSDGTCNIPIDGVNIGNLIKRGRPIYKVVSNNNVRYTTTPTNNAIVLSDLYGNRILAYTGPNSNTKFPDFPGGYDSNHPEKNVVDFRVDEWSQYGSILCANHEWAVKNNINWEGVSNYNHCK